MVQRGTEYVLGQRVINDQSCLEMLQKHVFAASVRSEMPGAAEFAAAYNMNPLQFDDKMVTLDFLMREIEAFFMDNRSVLLVDLDELELQKPKIEEKKQIDLNIDELKAENITLTDEKPQPQTNSTEKVKPGKVSAKVIKSKKQPTVPINPFSERPNPKQKGEQKRYVEKDTNYVPPPDHLPEARQKTIDNNLLEVFNFYCRKFAAVRGDFTQKNQNLVVLGLQGFTRFAKDFRVPQLTTTELTTVWKKSSNNHQPHDFE